LKREEEKINENNKKFQEGKSTFEEKLYPESNLPEAEFQKEKEGLVMPERVAKRSALGLIMPPMEERNNPENAAKLEGMYNELMNDRSAAPYSYSSVDSGN